MERLLAEAGNDRIWMEVKKPVRYKVKWSVVTRND